MLWKTLIFLAVATVVLAGRVKKHQSSYEFKIKHDYDYHHKKHEHEAEHHKEEEQQEEKKEVEQEENNNEGEQVQQEENNEGETQSEGEGSETQKPEHHDESKHSAYEFGYKVEDHHKHDIKGHHEKNDGEEIKGLYWLVQPDGYKRTVKYVANKHDGFKAEVDYSKIEEHKERYAPKSEYYITVYHELKKPTPITEEVNEEPEQDKQEESSQQIPIYVV